MKELLPLLIGIAIGIAVFSLLWRKGAFLKISAYVDQTREELRKCTWPTWGELWSSTKVVMVAIALLGAFTVTIDFVIASLVRLIVS
ncbi:MAG: preprotein translocase subunit SecE [Verrucomicrobiota bacterium]|nr:preprotein translocase subunit SecE [Verrucomicrobiota bacterium]